MRFFQEVELSNKARHADINKSKKRPLGARRAEVMKGQKLMDQLIIFLSENDPINKDRVPKFLVSI